jgi:hypothetical protein
MRQRLRRIGEKIGIGTSLRSQLETRFHLLLNTSVNYVFYFCHIVPIEFLRSQAKLVCIIQGRNAGENLGATGPMVDGICPPWME